MTILGDRVVPSEPTPALVTPTARKRSLGSAVVGWVTSTDHKVIGYMYLITATVWFLVAGLMALVIRAELAAPGMQFVSLEQYNQLFTMHGTIMLFLFATPLFVGFGNVIMPLQLGAPDVAFPRLNMLGYWLFLFGGITVALGFLTPGGAAAFGWFAYAPLSNAVYSPEVGGDLWLMGLAMGGLGTILGSVNFVTTIFCMRAPGMTMFRMPIFTWTIFVTSILVLLAFPVLAAALAMAFIDREFGSLVFASENGGAMLWQHLFWFFGHPEVYILALPFFGIASEIIPVFSRKPIFGYKGLVFATLAIGALSMAVWAHHLYVTGSVYLPYFAIMTMLIAVPTGVKFFNWIGTMWRGSVSFDTPMLWTMGFMVTFLFGGLTGIILSSPPLDFAVSDSYFVVAHFHYTVFGTVVFMFFAGLYYWWPKMTGRMLDERLGKIHFWLLFVGLPGDLPHPALARCQGHAPALRRLPAGGQLRAVQPDLDGGLGDARRVHAVLHLERPQDVALGPQGDRGRPVGLGWLPRVGDLLPAPAAQLRQPAPYPLGAPRLRPPPSRTRCSGSACHASKTCGTGD